MNPAIPYVAPFAAYIAFLALGGYLPLAFDAAYTARIAVVSAILAAVALPAVRLRAPRWPASIAIGVAVFLIWIGPDALIPGWRAHWLFSNAITGSVAATAPHHVRDDAWFIAVRVFGCAIVVPLAEELFWRGWLVRWLAGSGDFHKVPLGVYTTGSLWISSLLFASEHGVYWEVGLAAGLIYNLWMRSSKSLGDLVLTHAVTNACLSAYILATGKWEYWF